MQKNEKEGDMDVADWLKETKTLNEISFLKMLMFFAHQSGAEEFPNSGMSMAHMVSAATYEVLTGAEDWDMGVRQNLRMVEARILYQHEARIQGALKHDERRLTPELKKVLKAWCRFNFYSLGKSNPLFRIWGMYYGDQPTNKIVPYETSPLRITQRDIFPPLSFTNMKNAKEIGTRMAKYCQEEVGSIERNIF